MIIGNRAGNRGFMELSTGVHFRKELVYGI